MIGSVNRRIKYAKEHGARISNKGQNDTVIARPLIIQLDNETIENHKHIWMWDVVQILEDMFENENIVGFSVHRDETNVHMHVLFVPCHEVKKDNGKTKCSISQTQFFKNPRQLAGMHKHIRQKLCERGYKIQKENKPIEEQLAGYTDKQGVWHQQGLTPDQLKAITDRKKDLDEKERELMLSKKELETMSQAMTELQEKAKATQESLENNMRVFEYQQEDLENEKANLSTRMESLAKEKAKVEKMRNDTNDMLERVYSVSDICREILSQEHSLNKDFLKYLERIGQQNNIPLRKNFESLYRDFDKERKERQKRILGESFEVVDHRRKRTMDDVIAQRIRQQDEERASQFDFV